MKKTLICLAAISLSLSIQAQSAFIQRAPTVGTAVTAMFDMAAQVNSQNRTFTSSSVFDKAPDLSTLTAGTFARSSGPSVSAFNTGTIGTIGGVGIGLNSVPEPSTMALLASGVAGICFLRRRK